MIDLIIGKGQIGRAIYGILRQAKHNVYSYDLRDKFPSPIESTEVLHISIPYSEKFIDNVEKYIKQYKPWHVVIWSTVPIGTTKQIKGAVHSPVEGRHPRLGRSIRDSVRWIGANDDEGLFFEDYFKKLYLNTKLLKSSDYTEALKLLSTTEYGVNIEFARYKKQVADEIGMDFNLTKEWNKDYNKLYHNLGLNMFQKFVLDPPVGKKGGHCVTPNARLLHEQYPDKLTKIVGEL